MIQKSQNRWYQRIPHPLVMLSGIIVLTAILSYIIPAGEFQREIVEGRERVIPGTYEQVEQSPLSFLDTFLAIPGGFEAAIRVIFIVLSSGIMFGVLENSGMIENAVGTFIKKLGVERKYLLVIVMTFIFGALGVFVGYENNIALIPIAAITSLAIGGDLMLAAGIAVGGVTIGFGLSPVNTYTVGTGHTIAEMQMFSGWGLRTVLCVSALSFLAFINVRYFDKILKNPGKSLSLGIDTKGFDLSKPIEDYRMTANNWLILLIFVGGLGVTLYGVFTEHWYINEISAMFIIISIVAGIASRQSGREISETALKSVSVVAPGAFMVGFATSIKVAMEMGNISDTSVSLSATGKRVLMEARGEIFTVPTEFGDSRNITNSSGTADRRPIWSPEGDEIAWFSDEGGDKYRLYITKQDGISDKRSYDIGESKLGWEATWSPDGNHIAFVDDDVRVRVLNLESGNILTADVGGNNLERGRMGITWSPDSKMLAYSKSATNNFRRIMVWNSETNQVNQMTNDLADATAPTWDADMTHFYFLASTDVALGSSWANTSAMMADPSYAAYVVVLQEGVDSPFIPRSDEEKSESKEDEDEAEDKSEEEEEDDSGLMIDFEHIDRRTMALPLPPANYVTTARGPAGSFFLAERKPGQFSLTLHKFSLKDREAKEFMAGVRQFSISPDGKKIIMQAGPRWTVAGTGGPSGKGGKAVSVNLKMKLNRLEEWAQIFKEAWRYEQDYFYDPNMHGRDWNVVYDRYAPLIPHVRHRSDLNYILDMMNGELSVGHSFVRGGDYPSVERSQMGLLGADLALNKNRWQIQRIYTTESWNPGLTSPLDRPNIKVEEGYYLVGINGQELTSDMDPYQMLDGTAGVQTIIHINDKASFEDAWTETVEPIRSEAALRQRAWVEDNRRKVDELSNGRLGYIWVPNTGGPGYVSFNRYFFAQQNKEGAVIDERFNGGGLLDDYMVDLMTRSLRAGLTNEVPNGQAFSLPGGILGPKVLLINELAGSGGDFFPWAFRQQNAGQLIGMTTWGGLVKSSTHYAMIDGGSLTAPDNAVFDPINNVFVAENEGVAPDIEVMQDAKALSEGKDPQLERAVQELMKLINANPKQVVTPPPYNSPAKKNE